MEKLYVYRSFIVVPPRISTCGFEYIMNDFSTFCCMNWLERVKPNTFDKSHKGKPKSSSYI